MTDGPTSLPGPPPAPAHWTPPTPQPALPEPMPTPAPPRTVEKPHPLTPLVRGWVLVLAGAWTLGREFLTGYGDFRLPPLTWLTALAGVGLLILFMFAYLDWRATSFIADADELRIETGVFTKSSQRIRYERIQAVDLTQPFLPRLLGMAEVTIDVGAEGGQALRYLSRRRAAAMRAYLLARAHGAVADAPQLETPTGVLTDLAPDDHILVRVPPQRLVVGAALSHEVLLGFLPAVVVVAVVLAINAELAREIVTSSWALFGFVLPAVAGFWGFLATRLAGQWNYAFVRSAQGLKITRGLTSLTSQSVPRHRIQSLMIAQPIWWRRLGWYRVELAVLGNTGLDTEQGNATSTILLPVGTREEVDLVLRTVWPGLRLAGIEVHGSPDRARPLQPISHGWRGWGVDGTVLVTRDGWLTRRSVIVPHARVQSLMLVQGPLRRRLRLASVDVHTTNVLAACRAANLDADAARRLFTEQTERARTATYRGLLDAAPTTPSIAPMPAATPD